jgi:hypothetical protein
VRGWLRTEREPAVVWDVEPLVRVGGPRVGEADSLDEMAARRARGCPQPERSVDVEPRVGGADDLDDLRKRVERARVHLSGLRAHDDRAVEPGKCRA